jgi:hypothetical protein
MSLRLFVIAILIAGSIAARADTIYTFTVDIPNPLFDGTFVFPEPTILTSFTTVSSANITVTGPPVLDIIVDPLVDGCPQPAPGVSCIEVDYGNGNKLTQAFATQLTSPDTYTNSPFDTLTIASTPVPEPSTLLFFGSGVVGFIGAVRRKLRLAER